MPGPTLLLALALASLLTALPIPGGAVETAPEVVTVATLAARRSPKGKALTAWAKQVEEQSNGKLVLKIFFNGRKGDEQAMVDKIRAGKLDGALLSGLGLGLAHQPVAALTMPGLFRGAKPLNAALSAVGPELEAGAAENGFVLIGLGGAGLKRMFSKGTPINVPDDLETVKLARFQGDVVAPVTASVIGYTAIPTRPAELQASLTAGRVNAIEATSYEAEQKQWAPHLDRAHPDAVAVEIMGLALSKTRVNGLRPGLKNVLLSTAKKAARELSQTLRRRDREAFERIKKRCQVVQRSSEDKALWRAEHAAVREKLGQGVFSEALVEQLETLAGL